MSRRPTCLFPATRKQKVLTNGTRVSDWPAPAADNSFVSPAQVNVNWWSGYLYKYAIDSLCWFRSSKSWSPRQQLNLTRYSNSFQTTAALRRVRLSYLLWRSLNNCMMLMCLGRRRRYFIFFLDSHFVTPAFLHRRVPLPVHDRLSTNSHSSCLKSSVCDPTISDRKHSRAKAHKGDCDLPYLIFFRPFFDCDKQFFFPVSVNFCGADRKKRTSGGVLP